MISRGFPKSQRELYRHTVPDAVCSGHARQRLTALSPGAARMAFDHIQPAGDRILGLVRAGVVSLHVGPEFLRDNLDAALFETGGTHRLVIDDHRRCRNIGCLQVH